MAQLRGILFHGYRSFPSEQNAALLPLGKMNLIAGQNNTGKSNILRVIAKTYSDTAVPTSIWDRPLGDSAHTFRRAEFHLIEEISAWENIKLQPPEVVGQIAAFLDNTTLAADSPDGRGVWLGVADGGVTDGDDLERAAREMGNSHLANALSTALTQTGGGGAGDDAHRVLRWIVALRPVAPTAYTVGGVRTISDASGETPDLNGLSIKRRLLELQNPATDRLHDKQVFAQVQSFVRAVLDDPTVTIDIPHDLATIHVTQDGRTLPIENVGTGVHEVVIIAAAATVVQNSILCIEEPEVHLHPVLQRKLLRYLASSTTNQYFIATHSAHMLDSAIGNIFHVSRQDGISTVRYAGAARERAAICADLGYRPSDLVQTNAVIWVEGPSDRIYLKHWIEQLAPGAFTEGTHYSVMFYGGSLLSALSPLDTEEIEEFISLRRLNRYMVVVIDSDKRSARARLNSSKERVIAGLDEDPSTGFAWVTAGYTIENYVPEDLLTDAIRRAHPSTAARSFSGQHRWANPLAGGRLDLQQPSKVAIAKVATSNWKDEWPLDLKKRVREVVALIQAANSHT